jgi:hypothetical protein
MYKKKLPCQREANVLKVVVVVLFDYNLDTAGKSLRKLFHFS